MTQTIGHLWMVRSKRVLQDNQGLAVEWFGSFVMALDCMNVCQVVQTVGDFRTLGAKDSEMASARVDKALDFSVVSPGRDRAAPDCSRLWPALSRPGSFPKCPVTSGRAVRLH